MDKKPKKQCYTDLLGKLDKLDLQVEGIKDQIFRLKQLICQSPADIIVSPATELVAQPTLPQGEPQDE